VKRTKAYNRTLFTAGILSGAIAALGSRVTLTAASLMFADDSESYDNLADYFESYEQGRFVAARLAVRVGDSANFSTRFSHGSTTAEFDDVEESVVQRILNIFDGAQEHAHLSILQHPINIERDCVVAPLHWETLPQLPARLEQHRIYLTTTSISITRYPDTITYPDWPAALEHVRDNGDPLHYHIVMWGKGLLGDFTLRITKDKYTEERKWYLTVAVTGAPTFGVVDDIVAFLGLAADVRTPARRLTRSAFIAHRFDAGGEQAADRLARFLELLGFDVQTGRGFSPQSVGAKVRQRLEAQELMFVVLTPGDDATWITQESVLGYAKDKPMFILRETSMTVKPAIFGDLEYIPFSLPNVESTFIAILEGLRELGYLTFSG